MTRRTIAANGPNPVDVHVGQRMRQRRTLVGMSQTDLGEHLGISFQQVQKNEKGRNRLGASRLWQVSKLLGVPVCYFFEGLDGDSAPAADDPMTSRETLELVRAYDAIADETVRKRLGELVKAVARSAEREAA